MNLFDLDSDEISEGVFIIDDHGVALHLNETGAKMFGITPDEFTGRLIVDAIFGEGFISFLNNIK